ncbi:hypothetical protein ACJX0J_005650, partial [Zea mays]
IHCNLFLFGLIFNSFISNKEIKFATNYCRMKIDPIWKAKVSLMVREKQQNLQEPAEKCRSDSLLYLCLEKIHVQDLVKERHVYVWFTSRPIREYLSDYKTNLDMMDIILAKILLFF